MLSRLAALAGRAALESSSSTFSIARAIGSRGFATNSHDIFNVHRDTPDNNADTTFEWTKVPSDGKVGGFGVCAPIPLIDPNPSLFAYRRT
jgi:hypothetical protein